MTRSRPYRRGRPGGRRSARSGGRRGITGKLGKIIALATMPILVLIGGGWGLNEYVKIEQIDSSYCYVRPDQAQAAVFLDYSVNKDSSGAQRRDVMTALERTYSQLLPNGRVMIFTTARNTSGSIARPVFEICRPAASSAEQASIGAPSKPAPNLRRIAGDARAAVSMAPFAPLPSSWRSAGPSLSPRKSGRWSMWLSGAG